MFHQYARHCDAHAGCTVVSCVTDRDVDHPAGGVVLHAAGTEVWSSHLDAAIHVEHRINPDVAASDLRHDGTAIIPRPVCAACASHPAWPA